MTDTTTQATSVEVVEWTTPTLAQFLAVNPHMLNHSSRLVVDPEVEVAVNPDVTATNSGG
jgi:hypothetical protein